MKTAYKGFRIEAKCEKCLAGYSLLYYSALRESDGWEFISDYHDGAETIHNIISQVKWRIDYYLSHPEEYEDTDWNDFSEDEEEPDNPTNE